MTKIGFCSNPSHRRAFDDHGMLRCGQCFRIKTRWPHERVAPAQTVPDKVSFERLALWRTWYLKVWYREIDIIQAPALYLGELPPTRVTLLSVNERVAWNWGETKAICLASFPCVAHDASPEWGCMCGLYGFYNLDAETSFMTALAVLPLLAHRLERDSRSGLITVQGMVVGRFLAYGKTIKHRLGARVGYGQVTDLAGILPAPVGEYIQSQGVRVHHTPRRMVEEVTEREHRREAGRGVHPEADGGSDGDYPGIYSSPD